MDAELLSSGRRSAGGARLVAPRLVTRPVGYLIATQLIQVPPGEQPSVMSVIENDFHGIVSDRLHCPDADGFLAEHQDFLARAVSLDLRGGRMHAQILERQLETAAILKTHFQEPGLASNLDFGSHGIRHSPASIGPGL